MQELEISGKNIEEAISKGLQQLGCQREDVEVKILDEGTTGLFGLMGAKPAKVLLIVKGNVQNIDIDMACKNAKEIITNIISMMKIELKQIKVNYINSVLEVSLDTDSGSLLIGKSGSTLDSFEYVVQLMLNSNPSTRVRINIDTEGYRAKQEEKLKSIIQKAIEYVNRTKKIYRFDPMSAKERKYIHNYFKTVEGFETFSQGNGSTRKVGVKLVNK